MDITVIKTVLAHIRHPEHDIHHIFASEQSDQDYSTLKKIIVIPPRWIIHIDKYSHNIIWVINPYFKDITIKLDLSELSSNWKKIVVNNY